MYIGLNAKQLGEMRPSNNRAINVQFSLKKYVRKFGGNVGRSYLCNVIKGKGKENRARIAHYSAKAGPHWCACVVGRLTTENNCKKDAKKFGRLVASPYLCTIIKGTVEFSTKKSLKKYVRKFGG